MADDINPGYQYPFEMPSEEAVAFKDGAIEGRPAGVPGSYAEGGSTRWTPEAISEVHAKEPSLSIRSPNSMTGLTAA